MRGAVIFELDKLSSKGFNTYPKVKPNYPNIKPNQHHLPMSKDTSTITSKFDQALTLRQKFTKPLSYPLTLLLTLP